jgi:hypothetical protein
LAYSCPSQATTVGASFTGAVLLNAAVGTSAGVVDEALNVNAGAAGFIVAVDAVDGVLPILVVVDGGATAAGALAVVVTTGASGSLMGATLNAGGFVIVAPPNKDGICALVVCVGVAPKTKDAVVGAKVRTLTTGV